MKLQKVPVVLLVTSFKITDEKPVEVVVAAFLGEKKKIWLKPPKC